MAHHFLKDEKKDFDIFIPTLPHLKKTIENYVKNWSLKVAVITDLEEIESHYRYTSKALVCSGTASLEIAKRKIPQLVIYKFNIITEFIVKLFIKVKYANIINIFEGQMIIPEVTNSQLTKKYFLNEFSKLINDNENNIMQIKKITKAIRKIEADQPPFELAAKYINDYLILP